MNRHAAVPSKEKIMGSPTENDGHKNPGAGNVPATSRNPGTGPEPMPDRPGSDLPGDKPGNRITEEAPPGSTSTTVPQQSPEKPS